ncbi:MAG: hypothetical protein JNK38_12200 [Acidobacteria bacterium]|nr:hypothetical protein [Acidobacteriota bacterium]
MMNNRKWFQPEDVLKQEQNNRLQASAAEVRPETLMVSEWGRNRRARQTNRRVEFAALFAQSQVT